MSAVASSSRRRLDSPAAESDQSSDEERARKPKPDTETAGWTRETFTDQAIPKSRTTQDALIIQLAMLSDTLQRVRRHIEEGMQYAITVAKAIEEGSEDDGVIDDIERGLFGAIEQRYAIDVKLELLQAMRSTLDSDGILQYDFPGTQDQFFSECDRQLREWQAKSQRDKFKDVSEYQDFRTAVWEVNHKHEPCPPVTRWLERGEADESDDDLELGGMTQTFKCPITLRTYEDACKNTACGHHYSYEPVLQMLQAAGRGKKAIKCPVTGCNQPVARDTLVKDPAMQQRADEFERRQRRDSSAAEVDEDEDET